jgi:hypothetical protein
MLDKILVAAWGADWGVLVRGFPKQSEARDVKVPRISWHLDSEYPSEDHGRTEIKPRIREVVSGSGETFHYWAQKLDTVISFRIYDITDTNSDILAEKFKDVMAVYAGIFKENGVQEIIYRGQGKDELFGIKATAQELAVRPIQYLVRIERHTIEKLSNIEAIRVRITMMDSLDPDLRTWEADGGTHLISTYHQADTDT